MSGTIAKSDLSEAASKTDPMRNSRSISGAVLGGWKRILNHIPQTPMALRRRGRELLAAGNVAQASRLADRLARLDPRRAAHLRGEILAHLQPHHDHTEFWAAAAARFPADTDFARKAIHAALKAGNADVAEAGIRALIETRRTRSHDCNFVIGLANVYAAQGDHARIRLLVRRYLRSLRGTPDCGIAAVRLSRVIFSHFPGDRSIVCVKDGRKLDERFLTMLERSSAGAKPKTILRRVVAMERALASEGPRALFDTDVSEIQCRKFVSLVVDRLANGESFSFIRVGDGESNCLPYEPHLLEFAQKDAAERERVWWGVELGASDRAGIAERVSSAIWNADCLGVPTVSRILRDLKLFMWVV